jgi:N-formylglutamate amidohydrolase
MRTLSEAGALAALASGELFEAELEDGSLLIRVRDHVPHLCTAVHAGHRLRKDLSDQCLLDELARQTEEDPLTDQLIDGFPVILAARDSRYEYDLNRRPEDCVYETAWDKELWSSPLTAWKRY